MQPRHTMPFRVTSLRQQVQREQKLLSLTLRDVDYFKCYNDCYRHQESDQA
ncbi:diguanylate cyclase domain-containing protein [Phormidesmis sp. 146-35]